VNELITLFEYSDDPELRAILRNVLQKEGGVAGLRRAFGEFQKAYNGVAGNIKGENMFLAGNIKGENLFFAGYYVYKSEMEKVFTNSSNMLYGWMADAPVEGAYTYGVKNIAKADIMGDYLDIKTYMQDVDGGYVVEWRNDLKLTEAEEMFEGVKRLE